MNPCVCWNKNVSSLIDFCICIQILNLGCIQNSLPKLAPDVLVKLFNQLIEQRIAGWTLTCLMNSPYTHVNQSRCLFNNMYLMNRIISRRFWPCDSTTLAIPKISSKKLGTSDTFGMISNGGGVSIDEWSRNDFSTMVEFSKHDFSVSISSV